MWENKPSLDSLLCQQHFCQKNYHSRLMHVETIVSDISVVFWGTRCSLLKYVVESVCATKARSQRMKWTELNSSSRTLIRKRKSTVSRRIGIHALRTDWAPTVLDSLEPINTKNTRDDDARDQWTLHVTGSTSSGQPRSVQFSSVHALWCCGNKPLMWLIRTWRSWQHWNQSAIGSLVRPCIMHEQKGVFPSHTGR